MTDPRMMEPRISLVTLGVRDLAASVAFYRDLIGWIPTTATDEVAFFDLGGLVFGLWPHAELAADLGLVADGLGPYHGFTIAHNVRSRDEVDAVFESLRAAGATMGARRWKLTRRLAAARRRRASDELARRSRSEMRSDVRSEGGFGAAADWYTGVPATIARLGDHHKFCRGTNVQSGDPGQSGTWSLRPQTSRARAKRGNPTTLQ
jgi:catechol 2,3-dioxygenase-like lactoylglutathione lyase family enzyme